jgi:nicotinic acid phosphoribosyltransferase
VKEKCKRGAGTATNNKRCREMDAEKKEWTVLIRGIGVKKVVVSDDIDEAYMTAMKEFNCKLEDIFAVGSI